jgi:alpha-methylacyl-CoA racemase
VHSLHGVATHTEVALADAAAHLALPRVWGLTAGAGGADDAAGRASNDALGKQGNDALGKASNDAIGIVGGAHAGYRVYACADGRVAVAALEPHFAAALCRVAQWPVDGSSTLKSVQTTADTGTPASIEPSTHTPGAITATMLLPSTAQALTVFFSTHTCQQLDALAQQHDLPLFCMPNQPVTQVNPAQAAI